MTNINYQAHPQEYVDRLDIYVYSESIQKEGIASRPRENDALHSPRHKGRGNTIMTEYTAAYELADSVSTAADSDLYSSRWVDLATEYPEDEVDDCGACQGCKHLMKTTHWVCGNRTEVDEGLTQYVKIAQIQTCTQFQKPSLPSWLKAA